MSFKDLALPLVARGIHVIPVLPFSKETRLPGGEERGTLDPAQIAVWDRECPESNVGCLGTTNGVAIFDCDEPGLIERIQKETGKKVPRTFAVKALNGGGHLYFQQTDASRRVANKVGEAVFELRSSNLYVVGPGSKARNDGGAIGEYRVVCDAPIAPFPDFLGDWITANSSSKSSVAVGEVDTDSYRRLRKSYLENLNPADMMGLKDLTISSLHPTLHSLACLLHDGDRDADKIADILTDIAESYGHRGTRGPGEIAGIVENALLKAPTQFTLPEGHPDLAGFTSGTRIFSTEDLQKAYVKERVKERLYEEYATSETEEAPDELKYPMHVWAGTDYLEFVDRCGQDNFIPREFLLEAIKTVTGAVLGSALSIPDIEGGVPRFYTVLMGGAGSGKGTSISWASSVFKDILLGGTRIANLLWSPTTKIEDVPWVHIGACEEGFNSAQGMQRSNEKGQKRWLQTFEELDHMIEGSGIEGSGKALMGVNRQLYDREDFMTTTTGKRDAIAGLAQNSLLSATTPELWMDMFAGKAVRGSGLFQRFNLLVSDEHRKKGSLRKPRLEVFKARFAATVMDLDKAPIEMTVSDRVMTMMDEWFVQDKFENADSEVRGRLNVLAWRNALHLAWQRGLGSIGTRELEDALLLSDYQFEVRRRYTPAEGTTEGVLVENKIRGFLEIVKRARRREVFQRLNLRRYGNFTVDRALGSLQKAGTIRIIEETTPSGQKSISLEWLGDV